MRRVLEGAEIAVVGVDADSTARLEPRLAEQGAIVRACVLHRDAMATLASGGVCAVVLDVQSEPDRFLPLVTALAADARVQDVPRIVVADGDLPARRLAPLGAAAIIPADEATVTLVAALGDVWRRARALAEAVRRNQAMVERLHAAETRLAAVRGDAQTFSHDARVLCGIIVGYAANLRDGIVGPLEPIQQAHVAHILSAVGDIASLTERYAGAARAHADLPTHLAAPAAARAPSRRALADIAEIARGAAQMLADFASQKEIDLRADAPLTVPIWCEPMLIKQVVTNLVVNAIKFTPQGGRVTVAARLAAAAGSGGLAGRRLAELSVSDTGPGIPEGDRERVFERGVRLTRDSGIAGTGVGLAVVREIASAHGGAVRATAAPGGGAALVVELPVDMRARREHGVALVDDASAARRIVQALSEAGAREIVRERDMLIAALQGCRAVVVVPRRKLGEIEDAFRAEHAFPPVQSSPTDGGGE